MAERLEAAGLSQAELARRVGVSQPTIFKLIHRNKTGSAHLHRIARELQTTPAYLAGETDDPDADLPVEDYSSQERELVELFRGIAAENRKLVLQLVRQLAGCEPAPTLHDKQLTYRARD